MATHFSQDSHKYSDLVIYNLSSYIRLSIDHLLLCSIAIFLTMVTNGPIDYATTYFEKAVLTKISGRPDYKALHELFKELKANAASVMSDLGGGMYGHLGLLLTPVAYLRLTPHPYVRPAMPAALVIPHGTTNHEAIRLREEWQEEKRLFRETIDIEKTLIKQLVEAIDPVYLADLRNPVTNSITMPLADVMTHLFTRYGEVTQATLDVAAEKV